jgi:hypothetical protein
MSLRVGLVGYGFASKTFHAPLIDGVDGLTLAVISSSDAGKVALDWPHVKVVDDAQLIFADKSIDLVVIPTPNTSHYPLAQQVFGLVLRLSFELVVVLPCAVLDCKGLWYGLVLSGGCLMACSSRNCFVFVLGLSHAHALTRRFTDLVVDIVGTGVGEACCCGQTIHSDP